MRILFVTSEIYPLIKTGGLADVSGALPAALAPLGIDVKVLIPGYPAVLSRLEDVKTIAHLPDALLLEGLMPNTRVPVIAIEHHDYFSREGNPYLDKSGRDWPDNAVRFGHLSKIAARIASKDSPFDWMPDIVHCNDWQSGLAPAFMHFSGSKAKSILTIHNIAFQGNFTRDCIEKTGLPKSAFNMHGAEFYGHCSFLKGGLFYSNAITTVSPTYAMEIQTPEMGCGLDGLLAHRKKDVHGILNGIDPEEWNPDTDPHLSAHYDASRPDGKLAVKRALQQRLGLEQNDEAPLFGIVSRLTHQKGLDLVLACAPGFVDQGAQLAVLGSGDREFERAFLELAKRYPGQCATTIGYDEALAHQIMAGADIFLMPSRFEPCGLNQMYGMRYGTPPVVRKTGGLADSVIDGETGFMFEQPSADALSHAIDRSLASYRNKADFERIMKNGMNRDFGWTNSAKAYIELYESLLARY